MKPFIIHNDLRPIQEIEYENLNSNKVFIQYPIPKICNLRCKYCFHSEYFNKREDTIKYELIKGFTNDNFIAWMDKHIYSSFDKIVIHPSGGEPFFSSNLQEIKILTEITSSNVTLDFLTNGLFDSSVISFILTIKEKIHRIGFTYHTDSLNEKSIIKFKENVLTLNNHGISVYVKELFHKSDLVNILKRKTKWKKLGIKFKLQDFQNIDASSMKYNNIDLSFIDDEYKHQGKYCSCWQGYRSISIRGYDFDAGSVIACWLDPKIIGNIVENTLSLNFCVNIDTKLNRQNVTGGDFKYSSKGTFQRDRKFCEH